jgi:hypothetical protein
MYSRNRDLQIAATDAAQFLKPVLQDKLNEDAKAAGWPENIVNSLTVDFNGDSLLVKYPDELASEIDDLEYGKPYGVPNPVIRSFIYGSEPYIREVLVCRTLDLILDASEVF